MARHGHFVVVGHPQHIIARGNNCQIVFCCENQMTLTPFILGIWRWGHSICAVPWRLMHFTLARLFKIKFFETYHNILKVLRLYLAAER